ncbi:MAG: SHOCT domain-containing protein, partial [Desulfuromonadaceae bacterium]
AALFPSWTTGEFLDDGRLLVVDNGTLFLVSGFAAPVAGPAVPPEKLERLRTIRAWRASGLITDDEYASAKEKVMK